MSDSHERDFLARVVGTWLHMIAMNDQISRAASDDKLAEWFGETTPLVARVPSALEEACSYARAMQNFTDPCCRTTHHARL
jgi:hypothetical protein